MSINEADRLALRQELERVFNNPRHADTLMRSLPQTENTQVATRGDIAVLGTDLRREMNDLRREMEVMGRELRAEMKTETADLKTDIAEVTRQMAVQFRLTVLMQMGVLLAVISLMATRP